MSPCHSQCLPSPAEEYVHEGSYGLFLSLIETQGRIPRFQIVRRIGQVLPNPVLEWMPFDVDLPPLPPLLSLLRGSTVTIQHTVMGNPTSMLMVRERQLEPHRIMMVCPFCSKLITHLKRRVHEKSRWIEERARRNRQGHRLHKWCVIISSALKHFCPNCTEHLGSFCYKNILKAKEEQL